MNKEGPMGPKAASDNPERPTRLLKTHWFSQELIRLFSGVDHRSAPLWAGRRSAAPACSSDPDPDRPGPDLARPGASRIAEQRFCSPDGQSVIRRRPGNL